MCPAGTPRTPSAPGPPGPTARYHRGRGDPGFPCHPLPAFTPSLTRQVNPKYEGTFVFPNDFPALQPDAPEPGNFGEWSRLMGAPRLGSWGCCRVAWRGLGSASAPSACPLSVLPQMTVITPCFKLPQPGVCGKYRGSSGFGTRFVKNLQNGAGLGLLPSCSAYSVHTCSVLGSFWGFWPCPLSHCRQQSCEGLQRHPQSQPCMFPLQQGDVFPPLVGPDAAPHVPARDPGCHRCVGRAGD